MAAKPGCGSVTALTIETNWAVFPGMDLLEVYCQKGSRSSCEVGYMELCWWGWLPLSAQTLSSREGVEVNLSPKLYRMFPFHKLRLWVLSGVVLLPYTSPLSDTHYVCSEASRLFRHLLCFEGWGERKECCLMFFSKDYFPSSLIFKLSWLYSFPLFVCHVPEMTAFVWVTL